MIIIESKALVLMLFFFHGTAAVTVFTRAAIFDSPIDNGTGTAKDQYT
jgi:hypothetical protein